MTETSAAQGHGRSLRIAVTGSSGLVGKYAIDIFRKLGHTVYPVRRGAPGAGEAGWDTGSGHLTCPERVDVLLHLAGRSVATRWSAKAQREIMDSRVAATNKLSFFLAELPAEDRPKLFISASAIGIYGNRGDELLDETSAIAPERSSFLADVCRGWEAATKPAEEAGIRVVHPRIGVVLARDGGVVTLLTPTKLGLGGPVGSGLQWMSWISLTDLVGLMVHLMSATEIRGPVNAVAPAPVRQHEFMRTLGRVVHRPTIFPMPRLLVKAIFGRMGEEVLLGSQRVLPARLAGVYQFIHPTLESAIRAELTRAAAKNSP